MKGAIKGLEKHLLPLLQFVQKYRVLFCFAWKAFIFWNKPVRMCILRTHIFVIGFFLSKGRACEISKINAPSESYTKSCSTHHKGKLFSMDGICAHCAFPHTITNPIKQIYPRFRNAYLVKHPVLFSLLCCLSRIGDPSTPSWGFTIFT